METLSEISCEHCNLKFTPSKHKKTQRFCSTKCRQAAHYQNNKQQYADKFKEYYRTRVDALNKIKLEAGCATCGYNAHPAALEFNHIDPSQKTANVADKITSWSWERVLEEVDKCEVLCSNCHHIHSYETHYTKLGAA